MADSVLNVVAGFAPMAFLTRKARRAPRESRAAERCFGQGKLPSRIHRTLALLALVFLLLPRFGTAVAAQQTIRVVTDDNYPPFAFKNSQGKLEGIVVDEWRLWEAKTGIKVEIYGMDWGQALSRMHKGEFDVIDTIFKTPERTTYFDFTKPYASIEVPVFFRKGISGITDLASLKGFPVAAKQGDAAVELLRKAGVAPVLLFNNYDAIIKAAKEHKVNVFVIDKPPALYLLNKLGIENNFKMSPPLYVGEFRRAVRKGNTVLLREVEQGFAEVGDAELNRIKNKWYGQTLKGRPYLRNLGYAALVILVVVGLLVGWNRSLTKQVRKRTLDLRESESQLRKSKARLEEAQRIAHVGSWEWIAATDTPTWSRELCAILEVDPDKPVPALAEQHQLYTADSMDRMNTAVEKTMRMGEPYEIELERVRADGSRRWLLVRGEPWLDDAGQLIGLRGTALDITERKRAEESLRRSEERFREVAETIQEVFWVTDSEKQRMLYVSPAYEKIWGRTCRSLYDEPHSWVEALHPEDRDHVLLAARARQIAGTYEEEYRIVRPDGQVRWIQDRAFPVRNAAGQIERVVGVARDITNMKVAEEELHRREEHFRLLIENVSDVITVINSQGVMRYQSPSVRRVLGYAPEAIIGENTFKLIHPADVSTVAAAIQRALANPGAIVSAEYRIRHQDGQWHTFHSLGRSIAGQTEEGFIVVNSRDLTETRQLEEQFRQVQKMEAIGQLAGGVAHDFNNILAAIIMQAQLTETASNVPAEAQEGVRAIKVAAERAASLTRQLLMFSRKQIMQPAELDLNEVVTNLTKMLRRIIGEDIRLQLDLHSSPLMTRADAGMLDQILLNLAINARDAMPQGGRLHIQTSQKTVDEAMARLHPDATPGCFVWVSVSDTGCGIAPENLQRIFEPFFTTKEPGKGTGLGLATVFGIVKQHGGWIKVHSEPGQGTNFQVFLPAIEKSAGETAATAVPPEPPGGTETILLVEDDDTLRTLTRDTLELHGYRVLEAATGAEAVKLWPQYRDVVALLLTDLVMPGGMTGQQLAIQLQTDQPRLKVIYSSGYSAEIAGRELELHSWEGFLPKPYPPEQLLETIRRYLDT